jgi:hypothetical protein
MLDHLLLALYKAVLGVVYLAELVDEEFLCVADRHIFKLSLSLPNKVLLTRSCGRQRGRRLRDKQGLVKEP